MKAFSIVAVALALGCGHTQVQKPVEKSDVARESPERTPGVPDSVAPESSAGRLNQCTDGVAAQYNVPSEPETAGPIIEGLLESDQSRVKQEARLLGFLFAPRETPKAFCMIWDLREPAGQPDYIACHSVTFTPDQNVVIQRFPDMYLVDVDGQADGDTEQMFLFLDPDADGDVCNLVLVRDRANKN